MVRAKATSGILTKKLNIFLLRNHPLFCHPQLYYYCVHCVRLGGGEFRCHGGKCTFVRKNVYMWVSLSKCPFPKKVKKPNLQEPSSLTYPPILNVMRHSSPPHNQWDNKNLKCPFHFPKMKMLKLICILRSYQYQFYFDSYM